MIIWETDRCVIPSGTWRPVMFPSRWRGSASLPPTPRPLTQMTANRKQLTACRCLKVRFTTSLSTLSTITDHHRHLIIQTSGFSALSSLSQTPWCKFLVSSSCSLFSLAEPALLKDQSGLSALDKKSSDPATAVVGTSLPLPVPNKPESVVSITSQCSYSSTIVHVGDKKPQPESGTVPWKNFLSNPIYFIVAYLPYKDVRWVTLSLILFEQQVIKGLYYPFKKKIKKTGCSKSEAITASVKVCLNRFNPNPVSGGQGVRWLRSQFMYNGFHTFIK